MNRYSKIVACCLTGLFFVGCATGSVVLTGTARPSTDPESVKLYVKEPAKYDVIGLVEASSDAGFSDQGSQDYAVSKLKKLAAKVGANGILLSNTGTQKSAIIGSDGTTGIWGSNSKFIQGTAIFVSEE